MDEDVFFPDLGDYSQSNLASAVPSFPLDPSLGGPVASTSRGGGGDGSSDEDSWDEGDDDSVAEGDFGDDDDDDDGDETDAEDEYRAAVEGEGSGKRKRGPLGGTFEGVESGKGKGKGRAIYPGDESDGEHDGELGCVAVD